VCVYKATAPLLSPPQSLPAPNKTNTQPTTKRTGRVGVVAARAALLAAALGRLQADLREPIAAVGGQALPVGKGITLGAVLAGPLVAGCWCVCMVVVFVTPGGVF
jgi:hypothetical protein